MSVIGTMTNRLLVIIGVAVGLVPVVAWFTHVIVCLDEGKWGFLVAGALFFPIAVVHGIGIWFGFWH